MTEFSANLGFLWKELELPDAIHAAAAAGFDAVECHWPFQVSFEKIVTALAQTELTMQCLNTAPGNLEAGDRGTLAVPGREIEARCAIDQALSYAAAIGAPKIHVMAGVAQGRLAHDVFIGNLVYASDEAESYGINVLIEPINCYDVPGYFLQTSTQAKVIIETLARDNIKLMFDCYHIQIMEGDLSRRLRNLRSIIGHIQIASVPARAEPDQGEVDYRYIIAEIQRLGFTAPIGAEYIPASTTEAGLGWLPKLARVL